MLFKVREKLFSLRNEFVITDGQDNPMFKVIGKFFSWTNKMSFQNLEGEELALLQKVPFTFFATRYQILTKGTLYAEIQKHFTILKSRFTITEGDRSTLTLKGSLFSHEFQFFREGKPIASISKKRFSWRDSYGVDIPDGEDVLLILCSCIVIDQILHKNHSHGASHGR
ncbi:MAG: LURP-one-related family protein [Opitutales bacterium]|nr:LURP-one-related family protein [Opitutales bacterium]MCH8540202.1 LURP-one-related family protein [Opitutales bacterium]